jgi:hypothetical protein
VSVKAATSGRYQAVSKRAKGLRVSQKGESVAEENAESAAQEQAENESSAPSGPAAARHAQNPPGKGTPIQQAVAQMKRKGGK